MNRDIATFIEHARQKGMDHATIRMLLLSSGWKEKDVARAFTENVLELPVPPPPDAGSAREAFFHLLTFASFYTTAIAVTMLFFHFINHHLPDRAAPRVPGSGRWAQSSIRWELAVVMVAFPFFLGFSRFLMREMRSHPERAWSGVRRWLTYLTLFAAAIALGCDVITLLFNLLEGELSSRFLAKVLVVLVVASLSLAYYLASLRVPIGSPLTARLNRSFGAAATAVVAMSLLWGFVLAGSPGSARLERLDQRRIADLQGVVREIDIICLGDNRKLPIDERRLLKPLPARLEDVVAQASHVKPSIQDPATGETYRYELLDVHRFRLCAAFDTARDEEDQVAWNHPAGTACFERDALRPE